MPRRATSVAWIATSGCRRERPDLGHSAAARPAPAGRPAGRSAELEALAGAGELDDDGLLTLAEARWRTGDLTGAGEAAQAYLTAGGEAIVGLVIAAEATAAVGRPGEARRLAARALNRADVPLDRVFAGMPRSLIWPADPHEAGQPAGMLFARDEVPLAMGAEPDRDVPPVGVFPGRMSEPAGPGLWDAHGGGIGDLPDPATELEAAREALDAGRYAAAAVRMAICLRLGPSLAPAVIEAIDDSGAQRAELDVVRGDAYRLVGHELAARRAYASAARAVARPDDEASPADGGRAETDVADAAGAVGGRDAAETPAAAEWAAAGEWPAAAETSAAAEWPAAAERPAAAESPAAAETPGAAAPADGEEEA